MESLKKDILIYRAAVSMEEQRNEEEIEDLINYGESSYWNQRYSNSCGQRFQWLSSFTPLKALLQACMLKGKQTRILNVGCGNSRLQQSLYEEGYQNIVSNDISAVVIEQMEKAAKAQGYKKLKFDVMNVKEMSYEDQSFDLVIDKSTTDALLCSDNPLMNVTQMIEEVYRVLREGGYYFIVSYSEQRMKHLTRLISNFELVQKQLKGLSENGLEITTYLYIGKKLKMKQLTEQQRTEFYRKLKQQENEDYLS